MTSGGGIKGMSPIQGIDTCRGMRGLRVLLRIKGMSPIQGIDTRIISMIGLEIRDV